MANVACNGCGTMIDPANALYTADAQMVCAKCAAASDILETDKRAAHNIRNAGIACALTGVMSFFSPLSGFLLVVVGVIVMTFLSGIYAINSMANGQERFTRHLTPGDRVLIWFCSIFGMAVAGLMGLTVLLGWGLLF